MTLLRVMNKHIFPYATSIIYIIITVVVIQVIFFFFYTLFSCKPVQYMWERLDPHQKGMYYKKNPVFLHCYAIHIEINTPR
jgi:flagellar biosynthesis protein FlhB